MIGVIMVMRPSHEYMNGSSTTPPNCQNGSGVYKDNIDRTWYPATCLLHITGFLPNFSMF